MRYPSAGDYIIFLYYNRGVNSLMALTEYTVSSAFAKEEDCAYLMDVLTLLQKEGYVQIDTITENTEDTNVMLTLEGCMLGDALSSLFETKIS